MFCPFQEAAQQLLKRANVANAKRTQIASGGMSAIREVGFPWRLVVDFHGTFHGDSVGIDFTRYFLVMLYDVIVIYGMFLGDLMAIYGNLLVSFGNLLVSHGNLWVFYGI